MRVKILLAGLLSLVAIILLAWNKQSASDARAPTIRMPNGEVISLLVAETRTEREQGLSGRQALGARDGMLFVFPESGRHGIWMRNMRFSLDIIWLRPARTDARCAQNSAEKEMCLEVIDIREQATPDTFPESFAPREEAFYVLEINAGVAREMGIQRGEIVLFAR